jgi:hypothetical protein
MHADLNRKLHDDYTAVTKGSKGIGQDYGFIVSEDAIIADIPKEALKVLSLSFHGMWESRSFIDHPDPRSNDMRVVMEKICPQIGRVGWARYPGVDHYQISKDGKVVFKTKNYKFALKYLAAYVRNNPQPPRPSKAA